ncbi:hypothetical protein F5B20DRAFT_575574 [Whalleya microplaca]|nr:hypothetical protein F5B20DRAFT_575574 [Whalleya microplaca]
MPRQKSLSPEVINMIVNFVEDQRDLLTCTKVSHRWYASSCQLLYNRLEDRVRDRLLFWAALHGNLSTARRLLAAGARLDLVLDSGGNHPVVDLKWVYSNTSDLEPYSPYLHHCPNTCYWTAPSMAAYQGHHEMVKFFLDYAADHDSVVVEDRLLLCVDSESNIRSDDC